METAIFGKNPHPGKLARKKLSMTSGLIIIGAQVMITIPSQEVHMRALRIAIGSGLGMVLLALPASTQAQARKDGFWMGSAGITYIEPSKSKYWESGQGGEIQAQRWMTSDMGVGVYAAVQTWDMTTLYGVQNGNSTRISGDADFMNVGASLIYRSPMSKSQRWMAMFELGVEISEMDASGSYEVFTDSGTASSGLRSEGGANWRIMADLERKIPRGFMLFGGMGYVANINRPSVDSEVTVDNTLYSAKDIAGSDRYTDGLIFRLGLRKAF
jgi:hypothetical protein